MAYTKTKKNFSKSSSKSGAVSTASLVMKVNKLVKAYQPELKLLEQFTTDQSVPYTGIVNSLSACAAGDSIVNRDGWQISAKSLTIKAVLRWNAVALANKEASYYIIQDTQQQTDTVPTFSQIFGSSGTLCFLNSDTLGRFKILYKKKIVQDYLRPVIIDHHIKLNTNIRYNGSLNTDLQKNGLYMVVVSDAIDAFPKLTWISRLRYTDN